MDSVLQIVSVWAIPLILAITLHEAAHGYIADLCGDDTAKRLGRVTFNPIKHVDPIGTILLPASLLLLKAPFLFGYAKPVPVNFYRLRSPKRDMIYVAIAGPITNIILACVSLILLNYFSSTATDDLTLWIANNLRNSVWINVILAVFNMLPILPLDGGRVLTGLLPDPLSRKYAQTEKFGFPILILIIFIIPYMLQMVGVKFSLMYYLVLIPAIGVTNFLSGIFL